MSLVHLLDLAVGYGRRTIRSGLNAELAAGDFVCLVSTHDVEVAARHADRLWVLGDGDHLVEGAPADLAAAGTLDRAFASEYRLDPDTFQFRR